MTRIYVDVDIDEVFSEVSTKELKEELASRGEVHSLGFDTMEGEEILSRLQQGDVAEAILLLERALYPRYRTLDDCKKRLAKLVGSH